MRGGTPLLVLEKVGYQAHPLRQCPTLTHPMRRRLTGDVAGRPRLAYP